MGLMQDPTSGTPLVLTPHPVTLEGQKHIVAQMEQGEKLGPFLSRTVPGWADDAWEVRINGVLVPVEILDRVRPKETALVEVRGVVNKQVLAIVAIAVLAYFTMGAGLALYAGAVGVTSAVGASVLGAVTFAAGSALINKVLMPKPSSPTAQQSDPVYSIGSARNAPRAYEPLPLLFGTVRITPDVASMPYTWYEGNDQYLGMVLTPGINVHSVEDIYNGDTLLSAYEGATTYFNGLPGHADQYIPLYSNADTTDGGELDHGGTWVERTTSLDTVRIQINLEYLLGDTTSKGKPKNNRETVVAQYCPTGSGSWTTLAQRTFVSNNAQQTKRATLSADVARGQYDVRVHRLGQDTNIENAVAQFSWNTMTSVQSDEADYTGIPRIGVKIKATGQLSGALDEVRCVAHSLPVPVWNGSSWTTQQTSNPGAHLLAYARGIYDTNGRLLAGIGLPDSQIDIPSFQAFMVHCAANGYTYDAYIKDSRNHQEMVDAIALAGMGQSSWAGGKFGVVWADSAQPLTGVVNMATMKKGSFQVDYTLANAADGIEYTYIDPETWRATTLRVEAPGVTTMQNPARITGEGITSEVHAAKMARYHLAQHLYQYKDISYSADLEHLTYRRMSLLALSHDMTQWGYGGRLRAAVDDAGAVTITLDEPVPPPTSGNAYIGLRIPGEGVYRVFGAQGTRQNLIRNSASPGVSPWATASNPATAIPIGEIVADGVSFNAVRIGSGGAVWHRRTQGIENFAGGTVFAVTVYTQAGTSPSRRIVLRNNTTATESLVTGVGAGAVVSSTAAGAVQILSRETLDDGVTEKVQLRWTLAQGGIAQIGVGPDSVNVGDDVVLLGAQVEIGTAATEFIVTGSTEASTYGTSDTLTLVGSWPGDAPLPGDSDDNPAHDTVWIYDFKATPGYRVRVVQVEPEGDLKGARVAVVPESPEFWTYVNTGEYTPPVNQSSLLTRPVASNLRIGESTVVQGDTVFTELHAAFDVTGPMAYATIHIARLLDGEWGDLVQVAETRTQEARFRIPAAGAYRVFVRPFNADGIVGGVVSVDYVTVGADIPPPPFDVFDVEPLDGGIRKYTWAYNAGTFQAPDFAGAEIRYTAGAVAEPDWDAMTPVGDDGFHTAAFEAVVPVAGTWTFAARARNTSGDLSEMVVITRELAENLGEVIDGIHEATGEEVAARIQGDLDEAAARSAAIIAEQTARATAISDEAAARTVAIAAEASARADAILNEQNAREAAIETESTIRQSEDDSLAVAISLVSAGSGDQFDSKRIWYFDSDLESWTGTGTPTIVDGWLRPANGASAYVQSPDNLDIDGSAYRFVKLRIKKVGNPVWSGLLQWTTTTDNTFNTTKQNALPEPPFAADGTTTISFQDVSWWPATIRRIRLTLAATQSATDYFLIDWVAMGRPTPGAGVALVQDETAARVAGDAAEATQRNTLAVQLRGAYEGTDVAGVSSGLVYSERQARISGDGVNASAISALQARMPSGSGTLATEASVTAEAAARVAADSAIASDVSSLQARMPAGSGVLATAAAVNTLDARVTSVEGVNTTQAGQITALQTSVAGKADASALTALTGRVTTAENNITAQSGQITSLEARVGTDADNLIAVSTFESGVIGPWTTGTIVDTSTHGTRTKAIQFGASMYYTGSQYYIPVKPGDQFDASVDIDMTGASAGTVYQNMNWYDKNMVSIVTIGGSFPNADAGTGWATYTSNTFTAPANAAFVRPGFTAGTITGVARATNIRLQRRSQATVANASATGALDARVTSAEGTITAQASSLTTLSASMGAANANITELQQVVVTANASTLMLSNPGFEQDMGWLVPAETAYAVYASAHSGARVMRFGTGAGGVTAGRYVYSDQYFEIDGTRRLRGSFWNKVTQGPSGAAYVRMYFIWYDKDRVSLGAANVAASATTINRDWTRIIGSWITPPATAAFVRVQIGVNGADAPMYCYVDDVIAEVETPAVAQFNASYSLRLDVNGRVTGFVVNNDGTTGNFNILADNFAIIAPGGGARLEWSDGNQRVYDANGTLRVRMGVW